MLSSLNLVALKAMKCVDIKKKGPYKRGGMRHRVESDRSTIIP